jgi:hypothetical protein
VTPSDLVSTDRPCPQLGLAQIHQKGEASGACAQLGGDRKEQWINNVATCFIPSIIARLNVLLLLLFFNGYLFAKISIVGGRMAGMGRRS